MVKLLAPLLSILSGAPPAATPAHAERPPTGGELLELAAGDVGRLRRALREVLSRVEDARREKDLLKLLCADEKLTQLKGLVEVAERAETALTEAVATQDEGAAIESSKIAVARGKGDALRAEAAGCIGQLAYEVAGTTKVSVEEPADLPSVGETASGSLPAAGSDPYRNAFGIPSSAGR